MVMQVNITVSGMPEVKRFLNTLPDELKAASSDIEYDIAAEMRRLTRYFINRRFKQRTGKMWSSVQVIRLGNHWGVRAGGSVAPHFIVQEIGADIRGWHFVKHSGFGRFGEGYSRRGGDIHIPSRHPFNDAYISTARRVESIAERRLSKLGKR